MRKQLFSESKNIKENIKNDIFLQKQLDRIKADADMLVNETADSLSYTTFRTFYMTGSRKEYEQEYFQHRRRLNDFVMLSLAYDDNDKYLSCLQDAIWAELDEFTWALPAHIPQNTEIAECETWIDLFAAETAFTLAETAALFSGRLDNMIEERIVYEVRRRVIIPYLSGKKNRWDSLENNWSAVCAGSVGAAFLYLADDDEIKAVMPRIKNTFRCYLSGFGNDGACVEGLNYWIYGFGYFTYFAQLLYEYSDGKDNLFDNSKVKNIAMFPQKIRFKNNKTVSFSDCGDNFIHCSGLTHFLNKKYSEVVVPNDISALEFDGDGRYRFAHLIRDFAWRTVRTDKGRQKDCGFEYFKDAAWYIRKTKIYEFAAKAGTNDESHNHNDIASFLLNINGKGIITDPGRGEYTADYFSDRRYMYFAPSAAAHSVPIINGGLEQPGKEHSGNIIMADEDCLIIDFERAYSDAALTKLRRSFELHEDKIILTDKCVFSKAPESITEHFVFSEKPVQCKTGLEIDGLKIIYDTELLSCKISKQEFASDYDKFKTVYIADLEYMKPVKETEIKVEFI